MSDGHHPGGRALLDAMFAQAGKEDRAALLPYLTAGIPTVESSADMFVAMAEAGADGFEVGIPYADPLMDGPVIMQAGDLALTMGVTVDVALDVVTQVVDRTGKPVLVMTYVNPVLRNGIDDFFGRVQAAGGSGVILADLPLDEAVPFLVSASAHDLGMALFAAPTTGIDRLNLLAEMDPAFVYGIAEVGVTGERTHGSTNLASLSAAIRSVTDASIVFGVGISTPEQASEAAVHGDGVIVGSAIVRRVLESGSPDEAAALLGGAVGALAQAVRRG